MSRFLLVDGRDDRDHPRGAAARDLRGSAANTNSAREHLNLNRASAVTLVESATPSNPALTFPKIKNLLQNLFQVEATIFSIAILSIRLEIDPPCKETVLPIIPLATVLRSAGRSAGNII